MIKPQAGNKGHNISIWNFKLKIGHCGIEFEISNWNSGPVDFNLNFQIHFWYSWFSLLIFKLKFQLSRIQIENSNWNFNCPWFKLKFQIEIFIAFFQFEFSNWNFHSPEFHLNVKNQTFALLICRFVPAILLYCFQMGCPTTK